MSGGASSRCASRCRSPEGDSQNESCGGRSRSSSLDDSDQSPCKERQEPRSCTSQLSFSEQRLRKRRHHHKQPCDLGSPDSSRSLASETCWNEETEAFSNSSCSSFRSQKSNASVGLQALEVRVNKVVYAKSKAKVKPERLLSPKERTKRMNTRDQIFHETRSKLHNKRHNPSQKTVMDAPPALGGSEVHTPTTTESNHDGAHRDSVATSEKPSTGSSQARSVRDSLGLPDSSDMHPQSDHLVLSGALKQLSCDNHHNVSCHVQKRKENTSLAAYAAAQAAARSIAKGTPQEELEMRAELKSLSAAFKAGHQEYWSKSGSPRKTTGTSDAYQARIKPKRISEEDGRTNTLKHIDPDTEERAADEAFGMRELQRMSISLATTENVDMEGMTCETPSRGLFHVTDPSQLTPAQQRLRSSIQLLQPTNGENTPLSTPATPKPMTPKAPPMVSRLSLMTPRRMNTSNNLMAGTPRAMTGELLNWPPRSPSRVQTADGSSEMGPWFQATRGRTSRAKTIQLDQESSRGFSRLPTRHLSGLRTSVLLAMEDTPEAVPLSANTDARRIEDLGNTQTLSIA